MPLPVITGVFRVVFNWVGTNGERPQVSVQHFSFGGDAEGLAGLIDGNFQTNMLTAQPDGVDVDSVTITALDGISGAQTFDLTGWNGEGGSAEGLPGVNVLVLGYTGFRGSDNRGRIFLPTPREGIIDDGLLNAAAQPNILLAWDDFRLAMEGDSAPWGVASYVHADFDPYTSLAVPRKLGFIRRRRRAA
jgi:hypothetical protein